MDNIQSLITYYPYSERELYTPEFFEDSLCLLNLKQNQWRAINHFKNRFNQRLEEFKPFDYLLVIPGHNIGVSDFYQSVRAMLIEQDKLFPISRRIKVTKTTDYHDRSARTIATVLEEIKTTVDCQWGALRGKHIVLVDDVTTTGISLRSYKKYLLGILGNNVQVTMFAIGVTRNN
ncbi:hypothetical protein CYY_010096 [Polysphondylium violaceum]|uniref:Phosphoribosyltransferase domain-containing protein n=1 Tax=Polysphondylium violaceum TaxID=133409 RepID=A0A8J4PSA3_9MYCE|nr:hypothetical protein CYY_010096 [Polysphondylium violaceum]